MAAAVTLGILLIPAPAAAWDFTTPKPPAAKDRVIEVVDKIAPKRWNVRKAVNWLDRYTASDMRVVKRCSGKAYRCITLRSGKVRQGLDPKKRRELYARCKPLQADVCPFVNLPNAKKSHWGEGITAAQMQEIQWVIPRLVAQISFTEWTSGGNLRHATFKGLREDKKPRDVVREQ